MTATTLHLGKTEPVMLYLHWFDNNGIDLWTSIDFDVSEEGTLKMLIPGRGATYINPRDAFAVSSEHEYHKAIDERTEAALKKRRELWEQMEKLKTEMEALRKALNEHTR